MTLLSSNRRAAFDRDAIRVTVAGLLLVVAAIVIGWLAPVVRFASRTAGSEPASDRQFAVADRFRLGNAAGPFGVSTIIGDVNADGRGDQIVADRLFSSGGNYRYRVELEISGTPPQEITFDAPHEAFAIGASDVDGDNDVDLVARDPLSGETIALWINDGHDHFAAVDRPIKALQRFELQVLDADPLSAISALKLSARSNNVLASAVGTVRSAAHHAAIFLALRLSPVDCSRTLVSTRGPPHDSRALFI